MSFSADWIDFAVSGPAENYSETVCISRKHRRGRAEERQEEKHCRGDRTSRVRHQQHKELEVFMTFYVHWLSFYFHPLNSLDTRMIFYFSVISL